MYGYESQALRTTDQQLLSHPISCLESRSPTSNHKEQYLAEVSLSESASNGWADSDSDMERDM